MTIQEKVMKKRAEKGLKVSVKYKSTGREVDFYFSDPDKMIDFMNKQLDNGNAIK